MAYKKLKAADARKIALDGFKVLTLYRNEFPYNCGLCLDGTIWGDCWCMFPKVLIWSHAVGLNPFLKRKNKTYFYNGQNGSYDGIGASGLGDWDGDTIMSVCTDVRSNFSRMEVAELLLINGQHMAMYIGDYQLRGKTYNSVEFNYFDDENQGLIPFWTGSDGMRYWYKGGPSMGAKFDRIGKLSTWIDYSKEQLKVDGVWGKKTTSFAQQVYGIEKQAGKVPHQNKSYKKRAPGCSEDSWQFDGSKGWSWLIAAIQIDVGIILPPSHRKYGKFSATTRKRLQARIGVKADGIFGPESVKAFQRYLNKKMK